MTLRFPESHGDWKFDLVGLLAIIGESIVSEIVQPLTASRTILLPRLLPAPHALIRPSRRTALPSKPIAGVDVRSKTNLTSLPFFADMIHQFDLIQPYEFQEFFITLRDDFKLNSNIKLAKVKPLAPLKLITICSSLWTAGILVWAILLGDGPAVVAIVLVSVASSLHSAASLWRSDVNSDVRKRFVLPDIPEDMVLSTREGAFIVVHCPWVITRLLYTEGATCNYVFGGTAYQILVSVGTLLLMFGIVMMSNCSWTMQVILGASYLFLNGIYMFCALIPAVSRFWHWDLPLFDIATKTRRCTNYTETLWEAIRATRDTGWVIGGSKCPDTQEWKKWLAEARENFNNPDWDASSAKDRCMAAEAQKSRHASKEDGNPPPFQPPRRRPTLL